LYLDSGPGREARDFQTENQNIRLERLSDGDSGRFSPLQQAGLCRPTIHSIAESGLSDVLVLRSAEFLGDSDEKSFRPADVAEQIRVFILDYFAYELRAARTEPFKRLVDIVHSEHDAEVARAFTGAFR
jgi:hypothetical protein